MLRTLAPLLALAGCVSTASIPTPLAATTPVPVDRMFYAEPKGATATLVVKREVRPHLFIIPNNIWLDGKLVARVEGAENVVLRVAPGEHNVGISHFRDAESPATGSEVTVQPGQTYYFRLANDRYSHATLRPADSPDE